MNPSQDVAFMSSMSVAVNASGICTYTVHYSDVPCSGGHVDDIQQLSVAGTQVLPWLY